MPTGIAAIAKQRRKGLIDAVTTFLEQSAKIRLPSKWPIAVAISVIRNAITHAGGFLNKRQFEIVSSQSHLLPGLKLPRQSKRKRCEEEGSTSFQNVPIDKWGVFPSSAFCLHTIGEVSKLLDALEDQLRQ